MPRTLDQIVWAEVIRLLEEPALIQPELDRRLVAARSCDPTRKREQSLQRELTHVGKGIERLLNAYREELLSIDQLRERMPLLHQRQKTLRAELQSIVDQTNDRAGFLRNGCSASVALSATRPRETQSGGISKAIAERLKRMMIGWANYFCLGPVSKAYSAVDIHAHRRLRRWLCDKHNEPRPAYKRFPEASLHSVFGLV